MTIPLWGKNLVGFAAVHDKVRVCRSNSSALRTFLSLDLSLGSVFRRNRAGGAPPAAASGPRAPPQPRPQRPRCAGPPPGAAAGPLPGPRRPVPRGGRARRRLEALLPSSPPSFPPLPTAATAPLLPAAGRGRRGRRAGAALGNQTAPL